MKRGRVSQWKRALELMAAPVTVKEGELELMVAPGALLRALLDGEAQAWVAA